MVSAVKSEWTSFRFGDVCTKIGSGATPRGGNSVYLDSGSIALIRSQNVHNDGFHRDGLAYITQEHAIELENVEVRESDVLLNITGDSVARSCQVDPEVLPARVNQHVAIIRPDPRKLWPRFLRYYLVSPRMQTNMLSLAGSGATRNALTKGMIEDFKVAAPKDIKEQQAIACILGALDDKIELNRKMNETLEEIARAIFKSWFVDAIRDGLPNEWQETTLGEVIELAYGKALKEEDRHPGEVPVFGSNGQVGWHNVKLVDGPGIIVGRKGNPGTVTWSHTDFFPIDTTFYVIPKGQCRSLYFLFYSLQMLNLPSLSADSAVPGLNRNMAYMSPQVVPSADALTKFDKIVQGLFARIHCNEEQSHTLTGLRDALLPKLISGELRVTDAERFVERCA